MKLLIFDTETTGLPKNRKKDAIREPNNWPHIVSISWVILDVETNKIETTRSFIVKPIGWMIPSESTNIHGITHDDAMQKGVELVQVLGVFNSEKYDCLVAHNMEFDFNVLMNAYIWDLGVIVDDSKYRRKCTMKLSEDICNLQGQYGTRWPKLSELYEYAFNRKPTLSSLHDSLYDTMILTEIIQHCDKLRHKMGLPIKTLINTNDSNTSQSRTLSIKL
jgi:DNA polymerase-3 subunit epsilon